MDALVPGALLARRYRLLDRIGVGGMSVIWQARDELLERAVAVKVLAADLAADSRFRALVRAEARAAAALVHPHVTTVYDYGEAFNDDGQVIAFVVMELLSGEPLSARLTAGPLPWPAALRTAAEVADALADAHRLGIVHRDVTADNVMLTGAGAKVLDFGIATTVGAPDEDTDGLTFGTPAYVAPERLDGRRARPATDTYALGVLLFETLTGHPPYPAETWEELAEIRHGEPPRPVVPGLPEPVAALCQRCLDPQPRERPTASQVAEALRRHLASTGPRPGGGPAGLRRRVRPVLVAAGAAAVLAVGAVLGATVFRPEPPGADHPPAAATAPGAARSPGGAAGPDPVGPDQPEPAGSGEPDLGGAAPGPGPGPGPAGDPAPVPVPVPVPVTLATVSQLVIDGEASNHIRADVALDLRQLIDNLRRDLATGGTDLAAATELLREKVRTRAAEGALSEQSAAQLDAALSQVTT
jgi:serine/threonine-protein kinase